MALMLAGGEVGEAEADDALPASAVKPKVVGRLLEDDPSEKVAAAARHAALSKARESAARELPPLEYGSTKTPRPGKSGHNGTSSKTAAEHAAADLDPIEELISQIMVHEPEPRPARAVPPLPPQSVERPAAPKRSSNGVMPNIPLRELVLAWYESRGYRGSPASPAVWPIELVLRHREDAARAYAFVVQNDHVSVDRITALIEQALESGMMRVAVIAEAGYEKGAKEIAKRRHVRLIDRSSMEAELSELQLPMAAKIIAVARARSAAEPSAA